MLCLGAPNFSEKNPQKRKIAFFFLAKCFTIDVWQDAKDLSVPLLVWLNIHIFNFCANQSSHKNKKGNSPFYYIKIIFNRMSYIHFLSKIFFMIKWTSGFFIFVWRNVWFLDTHFSGESYDIMSICWTDLLSFGFSFIYVWH